MADVKISDMTPATEMLLADFFPIVSVGANFSVTRTVFMTRKSTDLAGWIGATPGFVGLTSTGIGSVIGEPGAGCQMVSVAGFGIVITAGGAISLSVPAANNFGLFCNSGNIQIDAIGNVVITNSGGLCPAITFAPGTPADWSPAPTSVYEAINRIAAAIVVITGTPIP